MDHQCHHEIATLAAGDFTLILTLFLTGLAGSFTHCIGMCGPIALAQMSTKLMRLAPNETNEITKLKISLFMPYYLGKAITYCLLASASFALKETLKDITALRYIAVLLLSIAVLYFLFNSLNLSKIFSRLPSLTLLNKLEKTIIRKTNLFSNDGFSGFLMGMLLGLIPCGLVYAAVVTATTSTDNALVAITAIFVFGMATIPGLFVVCYFGSTLLTKYKKAFSAFYSIIMAINALLIVQFIYKLL